MSETENQPKGGKEAEVLYENVDSQCKFKLLHIYQHSPSGPLLITMKVSANRLVGLRYVGAPDGSELARKDSVPSGTLSESKAKLKGTL